MEMRRRQFCLTVTAGVATTMIPGRPAEARVRRGRGTNFLIGGAVILGIGIGIGIAGAVGAVLVPAVVAGGVVVAAIGLVTILIGAVYCSPLYRMCSTGGGAGDVAAAARGGGEVLADLDQTNEVAAVDMPLQHIPDAGAEGRDAVAAVNEMIDAHNRLRSDIIDGRELQGAVTGLRQSIVQVRAEVDRLEVGECRSTAAEIAERRLSMRADGLPPAQANYLRGCGFSETAMEELRQRILQEDLSQGEGKSVVELIDEVAAAVPDASEFPILGPLTPVPDPGVD